MSGTMSTLLLTMAIQSPSVEVPSVDAIVANTRRLTAVERPCVYDRNSTDITVCGRRSGGISDPFGSGGAEAAAAELGIPFLGRVPLTIAIRTASDAGQPPAAGADDAVFGPIAAKVAHWLERSTPGA